MFQMFWSQGSPRSSEECLLTSEVTDVSGTWRSLGFVLLLTPEDNSVVVLLPSLKTLVKNMEMSRAFGEFPGTHHV